MENQNKVATVGEDGVSAKQTESHNEAINDNRDGCRINNKKSGRVSPALPAKRTF